MFQRLVYTALFCGIVSFATGRLGAVEFQVTDGTARKGSKQPSSSATPRTNGSSTNLDHRHDAENGAPAFTDAAPAPPRRPRPPQLPAANHFQYSDPGSVLDELPDDPIPPAPGFSPAPRDRFQSPLESHHAPGGEVLPESFGTTQLPEMTVDSQLESESLLDRNWDESDFIDDSYGSAAMTPFPCDGACGGACGGNCSPCGGWYMDLWLSQGFTWNPDNPQNNFNLPVTFNDRANEYQMNQLYLAFGRKVRSTGSSWDLGGRVDLLYGTDYFFTQAIGLETRRDGSPRWNSSDGPRGTGAAMYGLAMPQLFGEIYAPILNGVNFKIGHFYSTVGYESVMAPENFFYSHAYVRQYGEPFTHTGVMSTFGLGPNVDGHFAVVRGWDTWDDLNSNWGYLFGFVWEPTAVASFSATVYTGKEDPDGQQDRSLVSLVYTRQLSNRLRYVLQHDFGTEANAELDSNFQPDSAKWYGINQYLFMDINCLLTAGFRFEWFRDQDNARVLGLPLESEVEGGNYFQMTYGLNWQATDHMTVRPELRYDWSDVNQTRLAGDGMFDDFSDRNQFTAAMDVIFQF